MKYNLNGQFIKKNKTIRIKLEEEKYSESNIKKIRIISEISSRI